MPRLRRTPPRGWCRWSRWFDFLMNIVCISASNMVLPPREGSTSLRICESIRRTVEAIDSQARVDIIQLRSMSLQPCNGCGGCFHTHRCVVQDGFQDIYERIAAAQAVFFVAAHTAPFPAKLVALLERMEQLAFLPWARDNAHRAATHGIAAGIVSHGGGGEWALPSYKRMVNDTIANALDTIQMRVISFDEQWNAGISLPVAQVTNPVDSLFPCQQYDWVELEGRIAAYAGIVFREGLAKTFS